MYVDNLNLVRTSKELMRTIGYLKKKYVIKDLGNIILFQLIDRTFSNWSINPLVNIYKESIGALLYGQNKFINLFNDYLIT